ncbi:MAG: c-type cytochrome [Gallionella sp.]|nr:c-type cytochrome [Gallionella sp.]
MKYIVLIMCLLIDINAHAAEIPAIAKDHCGGCHAVEKTLYAPSLKAIAMKYRGDADAANKLTEAINRGGVSGWNSGMRMPPRGLNANDKEIKAMVEFIIELSAEDSGSK